MLSAICFNLDQSKILSSGNGLPCFGAYNTANFLALKNFKLGTACYTLQLAKPCFFPLENRSYRYQKSYLFRVGGAV